MLNSKTRAAQGFSLFFAIAGLVYFSTATAQYKCTINGSTVYSDTECAANAKNVRAPQDYVTQEQQLRKQIQNLKDQRRIDQIERREALEDEIRARESARQQEAHAQAVRAKKLKCEQLQRDIAGNKRDLARYEDFGMARSHRQRQDELRDNEDRYRRECR